MSAEDLEKPAAEHLPVVGRLRALSPDLPHVDGDAEKDFGPFATALLQRAMAKSGALGAVARELAFHSRHYIRAVSSTIDRAQLRVVTKMTLIAPVALSAGDALSLQYSPRQLMGGFIAGLAANAFGLAVSAAVMDEMLVRRPARAFKGLTTEDQACIMYGSGLLLTNLAQRLVM